MKKICLKFSLALTDRSLSCAKKDIAEGTLGLLAKNRRRDRISCLSSTMKELQQMVWCKPGFWVGVLFRTGILNSLLNLFTILETSRHAVQELLRGKWCEIAVPSHIICICESCSSHWLIRVKCMQKLFTLPLLQLTQWNTLKIMNAFGKTHGILKIEWPTERVLLIILKVYSWI